MEGHSPGAASDLPIRRVPLNFRLGDWTLLRLRLPLQVRQARLGEEGEGTVAVLPPAAMPAAGSEGFLLSAQPVAADLPVLSRVGNYLCYVPMQYDHYYIDLTCGFAAYQARFSAKTRSTINRKIRRFNEACDGQAVIREYRTPEAMADFFAAALPIARASYQERLFGGGLPGTADFVSRARTLAAEGRVRAYALFDRTTPAAYLYCQVTDQVASYDYVGYHPDYARWSAGTVLFWQALERMFADDALRFFDFTEGESEQKRQFATHQRRACSAMLVRRRIFNVLLLYLHHMFNRSVTIFGKMLAALGLKRRIRHLMRLGTRR